MARQDLAGIVGRERGRAERAEAELAGVLQWLRYCPEAYNPRSSWSHLRLRGETSAVRSAGQPQR